MRLIEVRSRAAMIPLCIPSCSLQQWCLWLVIAAAVEVHGFVTREEALQLWEQQERCKSSCTHGSSAKVYRCLKHHRTLVMVIVTVLAVQEVRFLKAHFFNLLLEFVGAESARQE